MIASLRGEIRVRGPDFVIVDVGGVGFRVQVPSSALEELGDVGDTVRLYTHLHVRDDALALYGFPTPEQLELFEALLGVSGVGPRLALSLLSCTSVETLRLAISQEDVDLLTRVPGVGRKTASRLILELKGKIDLTRLGLPGRAPVPPEQAELLEVLTNLGYSVAEAKEAIASLSEEAKGMPLEEQLRLALRYFGGL
ncbi:MAG: Holliday junction branch migration protein RuvA [Chloroflexia bacterium]